MVAFNFLLKKKSDFFQCKRNVKDVIFLKKFECKFNEALKIQYNVNFLLIQKKYYDELSNINKYSEQLKIIFFLNKYNIFYIKIKNLFIKI